MENEKIVNFEKEQKTEIIKKIKILAQKKAESDNQKFEMPSSEFVKNIIKELPKKLQEELITDYERLISYNVLNDNQINQEILINFQKIKNTYEHNFLKMPTKTFAKLKIAQWIDESIETEQEPTTKTLEKVARISIDLNGLKAVNDLTYSHEKGDDYLKIVKKALENNEFTKFLDENNVEHLETADGGDEFGVIMFKNTGIADELITKAMNMIKQNLENSDEAQKILDFSNPNIILAYNRISKQEIKKMTEEEKNITVKKLKKTIPNNYKFKAVASMGAANLFDGLLATEIRENDSYNQIIFKIMGKIFDISDKRMQSNKEIYKQAIEESDNQYDNFLAKIYSRTKAEQKLLQKIKQLEKIIQDMEKIENIKNELKNRHTY